MGSENFFAPIGNDRPFFKAALQGFAGTGKSFTSAEIAIGLHKRIGSTKPIVFFDTEKASGRLKRKFAEAGLEVLVRQSRSLADLSETMKLLRQGVSEILIIDSITHVYEDSITAYKKKKNRARLEFQDWGVIKPTWKQTFSEPFVIDPYHIIMTGRAGYEYESEKNEETGKREIIKTGIKMRADGETAYEPDMLILMERFEDILEDAKRVYRLGTIIKDRSTLIDGQTFKNPTYAHFAPAIDEILREPVTIDTPPEKDTGILFVTDEDKMRSQRERKIRLEEIEGLLVETWPGQEKESKRLKVEALEAAFSTRSWTAVESLSVAALDAGLETLVEFINTHTQKRSANESE